MPLDTQPLSPLRRFLMVSVLLALLAGSLGFAQFLIKRAPVPQVVIWKPPEVVWNLPNGEFKAGGAGGLNDPKAKSWTGTVAGQRREIRTVLEHLGSVTTADDQDEAAEGIFMDLMGVDPETEKSADLAGRGALELEAPFASGGFALLRVTFVDDHAAAISYSGLSDLTDADRKYFDSLCKRVVIHQPRAKNEPHRGAP